MSAHMNSYSFRIDAELKKQVGEILKARGTTHSEFIRHFYEQVVKHGGLSFLNLEEYK